LIFATADGIVLCRHGCKSKMTPDRDRFRLSQPIQTDWCEKRKSRFMKSSSRFIDSKVSRAESGSGTRTGFEINLSLDSVYRDLFTAIAEVMPQPTTSRAAAYVGTARHHGLLVLSSSASIDSYMRYKLSPRCNPPLFAVHSNASSNAQTTIQVFRFLCLNL
jgi:hypothetical protein